MMRTSEPPHWACTANAGLNGVVSMRLSIGSALLAATLMLAVSAQVTPAAAGAAATKKAQAASASDVSVRHRHYRYADHSHYPYPTYYGRPVIYAPAPFLPIPPLWGYGWEWW